MKVSIGHNNDILRFSAIFITYFSRNRHFSEPMVHWALPPVYQRSTPVRSLFEQFNRIPLPEITQHAISRTLDRKKNQPLVHYPGLALEMAHCMRLGDLYQLACADKLLDQNPALRSPTKASIWAKELIYVNRTFNPAQLFMPRVQRKCSYKQV